MIPVLWTVLPIHIHLIYPIPIGIRIRNPGCGSALFDATPNPTFHFDSDPHPDPDSQCCGSGMFIPEPGSWISDPVSKNSNKIGVKKN